MIAKIAVSAAIYAIDKPYSYRIPAGMKLSVGARVSVPFGRSNKRCEGVVLGVETGDESKLKPVDRVLDETPLLSAELLHMAAFLRERYFCTFYEAVKAILPAGVWFREQERYFLCDEAENGIQLWFLPFGPVPDAEKIIGEQYRHTDAERQKRAPHPEQDKHERRRAEKRAESV